MKQEDKNVIHSWSMETKPEMAYMLDSTDKSFHYKLIQEGIVIKLKQI